MKNKKNRPPLKPQSKPLWSKPGVASVSASGQVEIDPVKTLESTLAPTERDTELVATRESTMDMPEITLSRNLLQANTVDEPRVVAESLLAEVQSHLAKRTELVRRLREEIAATELRLEQLKRTAASLMPDRMAALIKEKKAKKGRLGPVTSTAVKGESTTDNNAESTNGT
jgi:hypothetical protein